MLTISPAQMDAFKRDYEARLLADYPRRLRSAFPVTLAAVSDETLRAWTARDVRHAALLQIDDERDTWRYLCLRYTLEPMSLPDYDRAVVRLTLHRTEWPARKRLNFVERHMLGRSSMRDVRSKPKTTA